MRLSRILAMVFPLVQLLPKAWTTRLRYLRIHCRLLHLFQVCIILAPLLFTLIYRLATSMAFQQDLMQEKLKWMLLHRCLHKQVLINTRFQLLWPHHQHLLWRQMSIHWLLPTLVWQRSQLLSLSLHSPAKEIRDVPKALLHGPILWIAIQFMEQ